DRSILFEGPCTEAGRMFWAPIEFQIPQGLLLASLPLLQLRLRAERTPFTYLHWLFFLFFHLPRNFIVAILSLHLVCFFFGHLSMNRTRFRRSGAALLFPVHYGAGDSIGFLLVLIPRLAHRKFHLRSWSRRGTASATSLRTFVIGFGLDFIR